MWNKNPLWTHKEGGSCWQCEETNQTWYEAQWCSSCDHGGSRDLHSDSRWCDSKLPCCHHSSPFSELLPLLGNIITHWGIHFAGFLELKNSQNWNNQWPYRKGNKSIIFRIMVGMLNMPNGCVLFFYLLVFLIRLLMPWWIFSFDLSHLYEHMKLSIYRVKHKAE